jgi:hypothetical protein
MLADVMLGLVVSAISRASAAPSVFVIDAALGIGLIDLRRGARTWVLVRVCGGVLLTAILAVSGLMRGERSPAAVVSLAQLVYVLAYATALALLLTGRSKSWRLVLATGIFVVGLASARLWEPFVGVAADQTAGGTQVAISLLLALAIAELVAAVVIKQLAQRSSLSNLAMLLLAIASVITMIWVAWLIGVTDIVEVFVVLILWPVAAFIVLAPHGRRKKPQSLLQSLPSDTWTASRTRWVPSAISFVLALFLNALVIVLMNRGIHGRVFGGQSGQAYLILCLPVTAMLLALGAWTGAKFAEGYGSSAWKGAVVGVWIGALLSVAISVWAILNGEPKMDW